MLKKEKLKIIALISLGSAFEFYDFTIYGLFSNYMSNNFFPPSLKNNSALGILYILLIFGVGYIARPIGGFIFGLIGDHRGRKSAFSVTLFLMACSTFCIGILPSYNEIGWLAPIFLVLLRIIQGVSIGAELPISSVFVYEHLSFGKFAFYGATLFGLSNLGMLAGNGLNLYLVNKLNLQELVEYGWRIPFILGGIFGIGALILRKMLNETPVFSSMVIELQPWKYIFKYHRSNIVTSILAALSYGLCVNFGFVLLFTMLEQLFKVPVETLALLTFISTLIFCFTDSIIGKIIDHYNYSLINVLIVGVAQFSISFALVIFCYANNYYSYGITAAIWLTIATSCFDSVIPNLLPQLFPPQVRSSGVATCYSISLGLAGVVTSILSVIIIAKIIPVYSLPILIFLVHIVSIWQIRKLSNNSQVSKD